MQGFILSLQPVRDEDLWVSVLTSESLLSLYRFYGARHSVIALGHKIDFCAKTQGKRGILCLRDVLHLGFLWEEERGKKLVWQEFVRLLFAHLR
ncbi:MAG: recombination protein RecO, partial [Helicobacter sp.]|nr:recombination protein RecO [Helicobacter sp.]